MTEDVNSNTFIYTYNKCRTSHEISVSVINWVLDRVLLHPNTPNEFEI
jgi:hypothetical protein